MFVCTEGWNKYRLSRLKYKFPLIWKELGLQNVEVSKGYRLSEVTTRQNIAKVLRLFESIDCGRI